MHLQGVPQPAVGFETTVTIGIVEEVFVTTGEHTSPSPAACRPARCQIGMPKTALGRHLIG